MKKSLRTLFTKRIRSKFSGILEITRLNGKKILNSENTNYSYGALEEVLDFGLAYAQAERSSEILVLGLGGGSVIGLLRKKYNYYGKVTAVEIDPVIIDIAVNEFQVQEQGPLELLCEDAFTYVNQSTGKFSFIIIDIFIDLDVPPQFYSAEFWKNISRLLEERGTVLFNSGINNDEQIGFNEVLKEMQTEIEIKKLDTGANTLLIGRKKPVKN